MIPSAGCHQDIIDKPLKHRFLRKSSYFPNHRDDIKNSGTLRDSEIS